MVLTLASSADPLPGAMTPARDMDPFFLFAGSLDPDHWDHGGGVGCESPEEPMSYGEHLIDLDMPVLDISARSGPLSLACTPVTMAAARKRPIWKNASLTEEFCLKKSSTSVPSHHHHHHHHRQHLKQSSFSAFEENFSDSDEEGSPGTRLSPAPHGPTTVRRRSTPYSSRSSPSEQFDGKTREQMDLLRLSCSCQARNTGKSQHLWEFLLEMLADKRMRSVIAWTGHAREFKVVNSREVAREWGNRKNKPHMNFDKMSRAMRYYYKKNILTHGNKQRLVYSFCQDAICPHYDQIIKIALRTRPSLTASRYEGSRGLSDMMTSPSPSPPPPPVPPISPPPSPAAPLPVVRPPAGRVKCERTLQQRPGWTPRRFDGTRARCEKHRTLWKQGPVPKIKINTNKPLTNDCFKFS